MQRPLPLGEKSIGVWNGVLEILSYLSLLSNTGLITLMMLRLNYFTERSILGPISFFLIILIINFYLRFFESTIFGEISYSVKELL